MILPLEGKDLQSHKIPGQEITVAIRLYYQNSLQASFGN